MNIKEKTVKQTNDAKRALPDGDMPDSADEETALPAEISDDAGTQPPKDPDDPLTDPQVKAGYEKLQEILNKEGDVELEMGRELNRVDEALKDNKTRHGRWGEILNDDLEIGYKKASRACAHANIHAWAEKTGNLDNLSKIPRSARYLLGAPKTTEEQREEVIRRVKKDDGIDIETVKRIVGRTKPNPPDESEENRNIRVLTVGFGRWMKKFNKADPKVQKRVIADIQKYQSDFVKSICPSAEHSEKPPAAPEST
jgi:hypothetical protein